jgi:predicted dehydrogenase
MERRNFIKSAVATGVTAGVAATTTSSPATSPQETSRAKYRGGIIGLGWMGLLYDLADRIPDRFKIEDVNRPTPELDIHRKFYHHQHPGNEGLPTSYAEALFNRPEVELVAGADRDKNRLQAFGERYGLQAIYTDGLEMLRKENLDIVAIATNTRGRAFLTVKAAEAGAKGIFTEKPMAHTLEEADRMVGICKDRGIALCCGAITTTHPSFERARNLVRDGEIGEVYSLETAGPSAQHQGWCYFLNSEPAWVVGSGQTVRKDGLSDEFNGQGMLSTRDGQIVHFRKGAPKLRVSGSRGEITFDYNTGWRMWQNIGTMDTPDGDQRPVIVEKPWPFPQFVPPYGAVYCLDDIIRCLEGDLDEPKNSGRRVAMALEVEIALKESSRQDGARVDLPLEDRSGRLNYDWFR